MKCALSFASVALLGCFLWVATGPAMAQGEPERVPLIMTKLPPAGSPTYKRIIGKAGKARGQVLTLTKTEMWEVPKENVEAVKKAAAEHGAVANPLGADWNEVFHSAPADMRMNAKQNANDGDGQDLQVDHGCRHDGRRRWRRWSSLR